MGLGAYRILSIPLRLGELAFAATVMGIVGHYLQVVNAPGIWLSPRFLFTLVISGFSMFMALCWLIPYSWKFQIFPIDFILFIAWVVDFGLLANYSQTLNCGNIWAWGEIMGHGTCSQWKAGVAFAFLAACLWLLSATMILILLKRRASLKLWYKPVKI